MPVWLRLVNEETATDCGVILANIDYLVVSVQPVPGGLGAFAPCLMMEGGDPILAYFKPSKRVPGAGTWVWIGDDEEHVEFAEYTDIVIDRMDGRSAAYETDNRQYCDGPGIT